MDGLNPILANGGDETAEGSDSDYQIPKREVVAELVLVGQSPRRVRLYLSQAAERHTGPERPSDLLNAAGPFIPACDTEEGCMLLHRDSIVTLTVPASEEAMPEVDAETEGDRAVTTHGADLQLVDGRRLSGSLRYVRPEGLRRPLDYLNSCERFFAVHDDGQVHLVNRGHVLTVATE